MRLFLAILLFIPLLTTAQRRTSTSFETANVFDSITFVESCCAYSFVKSAFWKYKGNNSVRVEGRRTDDVVETGGKRQELNFNSAPDTNSRYVIEWFRWSHMIPDSMQLDLTGKDFIIQQFKQPGVGGVQTGGSPPLAILIDSNVYKADIRWATAANPNNNNSSNRRLITLGTLVKNQVDHWVIRYRYTSETTGTIHIWRNDTLVLADTGRNYYEGAGRAAVKVGMYHYRWSEASYGGSISTYRVMYIDDIGVFGPSSTYEDVATFRATSNPPVVTVPNYTTTNSSITLTASVTSDNPIVDYSWSGLSGPNTPSVSVPAAGQITLSGLINGTYTWQITVTDSEGGTDSAVSTITKTEAIVERVFRFKKKQKVRGQ